MMNKRLVLATLVYTRQGVHLRILLFVPVSLRA